jgi:hypothetical protein
MPDDLVSIDEFLTARKAFVKCGPKGGDILVKGRSNAASSWDKDKRTIRFVMSAEVEDRDKDIVFQSGLDITEFLKNPVAPFGHRSYDFPIGGWQDVEKLLTGRPKRTEGTLKLLEEGTDGVADRLAFHFGQGSIKACSIGFVPKSVKRRPNPEGTPPDTYMYNGYEILESELVECSPVTIPSNPLALAKSAAHGDVLARETIEEILDTWAKTEAGLLVPREEYEAAHKQAGRNTFSVVFDPKKVTPELIESLKAATDCNVEFRLAEPVKEPEEKTTVGLLEKILNAVTGKDAAEAQRIQAEQAAATAAAEQEAAAIETRKARAKEVAEALERRMKARERHDALEQRVQRHAA